MKNSIQNQFSGFLNTPNLWEKDLCGLHQYEFNVDAIPIMDTNFKFNQRLGKRVEQFVHFQLQHSKDIRILAENIQIKKQKDTIGELDMILLQNHRPIHLEIAYKFYLFDPNYAKNDDLSCWIGPNRKDNLSLKLKKLKEKQLPLLHRPECKKTLNSLGLEAHSIKQSICFKAQLFTPLGIEHNPISPINKACIVGFYLNYKNIESLRGYYIYIPEKIDWLMASNLSVDWNNYESLKPDLQLLLERKQSPLLWLKDNKGALQKCFLTWW